MISSRCSLTTVSSSGSASGPEWIIAAVSPSAATWMNNWARCRVEVSRSSPSIWTAANTIAASVKPKRMAQGTKTRARTLASSFLQVLRNGPKGVPFRNCVEQGTDQEDFRIVALGAVDWGERRGA